MDLTRPYLVVMGDLVGSSEYDPAQRHALQLRFHDALARLKAARGDSLVAGPAINAGDEFQAVLADPALVPDLAWDLHELLDGPRLRIGVGLGAIYTAPDDDVRHMDGPAFHAARRALEAAKRNRELAPLFQGFGESRDRVLDGLGALLECHRARLTPRQHDVCRLLRLGHAQEAAARELGVSKQMVSEHAKRAGWRQYRAGEQALREALALFSHAEDGRLSA